MPQLAPCLWFDGKAEEAAELYVSLFSDAEITMVSRYGSGANYPQGTALMVEFTLSGRRFQALNGGPHYNFTPAISLSVSCKDAAEVDYFWDALTANGGEEGRCGWLTDRFGVSWQVVPEGLGALMSDPDPERARRATQAMMTMKKLDIDAMRAAADKNPG